MSKKIIISLFVLAATLVGLSSATAAYFSGNAVLGDNTFKTGTVKFDSDAILADKINLTNLTPGKTVASDVVGIRYDGSINADLYVGMKATAGGDLKPVLDYYIDEVQQNGTFIRNVTGWRNIETLFGAWTQVASNTPMGPRYYKFYVKMRDTAGNTYQNMTVKDDLIIHAVQHGFSAPSTAPWVYNPSSI